MAKQRTQEKKINEKRPVLSFFLFFFNVNRRSNSRSVEEKEDVDEERKKERTRELQSLIYAKLLSISKKTDIDYSMIFSWEIDRDREFIH